MLLSADGAEGEVVALRRRARLRALLRRLPVPRMRSLLRQEVSWLPEALLGLPWRRVAADVSPSELARRKQVAPQHQACGA